MLCSVIHGACHIARAAYEKNPGGLVVGDLNRSGLVALLLLLITALPMSVGFIQDKVRCFSLFLLPPPPLSLSSV